VVVGWEGSSGARRQAPISVLFQEFRRQLLLATTRLKSTLYAAGDKLGITVELVSQLNNLRHSTLGTTVGKIKPPPGPPI
jgi:hypothetical protein